MLNLSLFQGASFSEIREFPSSVTEIYRNRLLHDLISKYLEYSCK